MSGEKLNPTVLRLQRERASLKERLRGLEKQYHLTTDEELERRRIQKLRLLKKDQLALLNALG